MSNATKLSGDASYSGLRVYQIPKSLMTDNQDLSIEELGASATELKTYFCRHCQCLFMDHVMYTIHAGCHGFRDPYECNVCGYRATDRYQFQSHIARGEHFSSKESTESQQKSPVSSPAVNTSTTYTASMDTAQISPKGYADFISRYENSIKKRANETAILENHVNGEEDKNIMDRKNLMLINAMVQ